MMYTLFIYFLGIPLVLFTPLAVVVYIQDRIAHQRYEALMSYHRRRIYGMGA
jgi:hypothetical protein